MFFSNKLSHAWSRVSNIKKGSPNGKKSFGLHVYKVCTHIYIVHFKPNLGHSIHKDSLTSYLKDSHNKSNIYVPLWVIVICL